MAVLIDASTVDEEDVDVVEVVAVLAVEEEPEAVAVLFFDLQAATAVTPIMNMKMNFFIGGFKIETLMQISFQE